MPKFKRRYGFNTERLYDDANHLMYSEDMTYGRIRFHIQCYNNLVIMYQYKPSATLKITSNGTHLENDEESPGKFNLDQFEIDEFTELVPDIIAAWKIYESNRVLQDLYSLPVYLNKVLCANEK